MGDAQALTQRDVAGWLSAALGRDAPDALVDYVYRNSEGMPSSSSR